MERIIAQSEQFKTLFEACNEKIKAEPDNLEAKRLRGLLLNISDMYKEAIAELSQVIAMKPDDERSYYVRGDSHYKLGDHRLAKQDYLRALKIQNFDDVEFAEGYTEKMISEVIINDKQELEDIKKVLDYEKKKVILSYFNGV